MFHFNTKDEQYFFSFAFLGRKGGSRKGSFKKTGTIFLKVMNYRKWKVHFVINSISPYIRD